MLGQQGFKPITFSTEVWSSYYYLCIILQIWGRTLLDSFQVHAGQPGDDNDDEMSSDSETENTEDAGPASRTRSRHQQAFNPFMPARARIRLGTRRNHVQMMPPIDA